MSLRYTQLSFQDPHPCPTDQPLLEKLGLAPFFLPRNQEHFVGSFKFDNGAVVEIRVQAAFALRWDITILTPAAPQPIYREWSGALAEHWPLVEALAHGVAVSA